jgi:hypothetical protein
LLRHMWYQRRKHLGGVRRMKRKLKQNWNVCGNWILCALPCCLIVIPVFHSWIKSLTHAITRILLQIANWFQSPS